MITITEAMRYSLATRAREVFKEEGEILMEHLPIGGNTEVVVNAGLEKTVLNLKLDIRDLIIKLFFAMAGLNVSTFAMLLAAIKWM